MRHKKLTYGIIGTAAVWCVFTYLFAYQDDQTIQSVRPQVSRANAAILDHLSLSFPNPAFVKASTDVLKEAGFTVDYYEGKDVTVELYRALPAHGYDLILLRVHSAYIDKAGTLAMFSGEPYSKERYVYEQLRNRIACGFIEPYQKGDPRYLAITDEFVRHSMNGMFDNTVIVMMGCFGIKRSSATAFLEKGAKVYIGWDGAVSASHTDQATIQLLKHLLIDKETVGKAVAQTMNKVGWEPQYKSSLLFWPIRAQNYTVQRPDNCNMAIQ